VHTGGGRRLGRGAPLGGAIEMPARFLLCVGAGSLRGDQRTQEDQGKGYLFMLLSVL
jgi:hypothetical protein